MLAEALQPGIELNIEAKEKWWATICDVLSIKENGLASGFAS